MQMSTLDKLRFAKIFLHALWTPTDTLTAAVIRSEDGNYLMMVDDGESTPDACMMYR